MLYFDEASHTYIFCDKILRSVSSIVASQFRKFNSHCVSRSIAKSRSNDKESVYFGMTQEEIVQRWNEASKESRDAGTELHRNIENFYVFGARPENEDKIEWQQFLQFVNDHPSWVCIGNEKQVHNGSVAGTIDAIFDTPEGVVLVDWKRTKAIDFSGYGMGKDVMKHVADCNYSKYSLQLSLYKNLCAFEVTACYIVQMHPSIEKYQKIRAQDFSIEANMLIKS